MHAQGLVLWDFDGTLAWREGLWSGCMIEVLDEHAPGHSATRASVRAAMRGAYPWNRHAQPHPELGDPEAWWAGLTPSITAAIETAGVARERAGELAVHVRQRFTDPSIGWSLFPDTRAALQTVADGGWRSAILSNHVPELARLVAALGISPLIEHVFTSAHSGYEKPHPEAFLGALRRCGNPQRVWMVGDNPHADIAGASALSIPSLLVRSPGHGPHVCRDALHAATRITSRGREFAAR